MIPNPARKIKDVSLGLRQMQVPSNIIIAKITRPSWYIAGAMLIWGAISVLTGITHNFVGALLTRFFLGFIEAAFLPGALFLLSKWYTKKEIALRYTILYSGNLISNAFGSLIAAGVLNNMQGVAGHAAWRWLFFIEGALTMGVALIAAVMLPDTLENSRGFSQEELAVARLRMMEDVGEADTATTDEKWYDGLRLCLVDYKIYILMLSLIAVVTGLAIDTNRLPHQSFNAYLTETLLLCAPPWFFAVIVSLINSWHADKTQEKFYHSTWPLVMGIIGFIISMCTMNTAARYVALFLQAGSYAGYIIMYWEVQRLKEKIESILPSFSHASSSPPTLGKTTQPTADDIFRLVQSMSASFLDSYLPIMHHRINMPFTEEERRWQLMRRGRYVEFNLVHDRGTKFGLFTPGARIESILMSLPQTARWEYMSDMGAPGSGTREEELMKVLKTPVDWADV
ncbi:hypothetical protein QFC20_007820 [Naganishia adeliensis]|uniref:Uncharacterized protein n=1 Tax=Naganishia adeliensis TaxID=92952 RepID=A0ACC2UVB0_9TREE|nr:hypothetical protein QFC20_007820 [Naganishia adeliensis]